MQKQTWMISYLFKEWLSLFSKSIPWGISQDNPHLLILDGHGSHVMIEAFEQVIEIGLNMVTLPSHTSHALQLSDMTCFKPFKNAFRKEQDLTMVKNKYLELNKMTCW
jgi:hypothetical protein